MLGGLTSDYFMGLSFANVFRPDLVPGQTIWVTDHSAPGGRWLNPSAFRPAADFVQGNLGRNVITGFGMDQIDLALQRDFALLERRSLQFRIEAFNALNHRNNLTRNGTFGSGTYPSNPSPSFGQITSVNDPRSLQMALRLSF